jgi:hypothetical protein
MTTPRDMADPWDAGVVFFFGFLSGLSSLALILVATGWLA